MKVLLIGNYKNDNQVSMLLFGDLLHKELKDKDLDIELWQPKMSLARDKKSTLNKYLGYIDKFIVGSIQLFFKQLFTDYDTYHILDHGNAIYVNVLPKAKTLITCHDCIAIEEALYGRTGENVGKFGIVLQKLIVNGLRKANKIISVSNATKEDLLRLLKINETKIKLIYNCSYSNIINLSYEESIKILNKYDLSTGDKFIFSLGNNLIRKNRKRIVEAYIKYRDENSNSDLKLWIGGKELSNEINHIVQNTKYSEDIRFLGRVDDELLNALYSKCTIFAFPSIDEGFGVPIVEAQICNTIVITSNKIPMSEVAGDSAILVDPYSVDSIADAFNNYKNYPNLEEKIKNNVRKFSKENMINNYKNIYQGLKNG